MTATPTSGELHKAAKPKKRKPTKTERQAALDRATERTRAAMPSMPTPEMQAHHEVEQRGSVDAPKGHSGYIVRDDRWIDRYWLDGRLNDREYEAANRLYDIWLATGLSPRWIGDYGTSVDGGPTDCDGIRQQEALDMLRWVKERVDYRQWCVLEACVIWDVPPGPRLNIRKRDSDKIEMLRAALARLADLWRV